MKMYFTDRALHPGKYPKYIGVRTKLGDVDDDIPSSNLSSSIDEAEIAAAEMQDRERQERFLDNWSPTQNQYRINFISRPFSIIIFLKIE